MRKGATAAAGKGARLRAGVALARHVVHERGGRDGLAGAGRALDERQRRRQHGLHGAALTLREGFHPSQNPNSNEATLTKPYINPKNIDRQLIHQEIPSAL
jgi:hypothetical protein